MILNNITFIPPFMFIFEPRNWDVQIEIGVGFDGRVTPEENFPVVISKFHNGCKSDIQHSQIFVGLSVPHNFDFFSFTISDYLTSDKDLVGQVKYVESDVVGNISVIDLLLGSQT